MSIIPYAPLDWIELVKRFAERSAAPLFQTIVQFSSLFDITNGYFKRLAERSVPPLVFQPRSLFDITAGYFKLRVSGVALPSEIAQKIQNMQKCNTCFTAFDPSVEGEKLEHKFFQLELSTCGYCFEKFKREILVNRKQKELERKKRDVQIIFSAIYESYYNTTKGIGGSFWST